MKHAQYLTLVKIYPRLWSVIGSHVLLRFSRISRIWGVILPLFVLWNTNRGVIWETLMDWR